MSFNFHDNLHNIIFNTKVFMDNLNMGAYNDKLSQIRARVMSKQKQRQKERQGGYKHVNENMTGFKSTSKYESTLSKYHGGHRELQKYQRRMNNYDTRQKDSYQARSKDKFDLKGRQCYGSRSRDNYEYRKPLEVRKQAESNVMDRVKELQNVNDKIKMMLANKRDVHQSISTAAIPSRSKSRRMRKDQQNLTPQRMTSLFQNEHPIVQSKVASREKRIPEYDYQYKTILDNNFSQDKRRAQFDSIKKNESLADNQFSVQTPLATLCAQTGRQKYESPCKKKLFSFQVDSKEQPFLTFKKAEQNKQDKPFEVKMRYSGNGQSKKIVSMLLKQIQLDIKLRQSKEFFASSSDENKWDKIRRTVKTYGVDLTSEELENWINLSRQECDPFFESNYTASFDFVQFAARIVAGWQCWNNQVKQCADIEGLEKQGFKIQEVDLGRRGYITMQDFVCYINVNADTFFRTRDICPIFRRLKGTPINQKLENKLKYETFLSYMVK